MMKQTISLAIYHFAAFLLCALMTIQTPAAPGDFDQFGNRRHLQKPQLNLTVTRSDDRNNATCASGDCSLREAVNAANASATDDTINFAPGLTTITLTNEIIINNAGTLAINGTGANVLTINAGPGKNRIFYTNQATVTISGVSLTGGYVTPGISSSGGAIYANEGSLTLDNVYITGNRATDRGGGVFFSGGTHRIINSTFSADSASCGGGFASSLNTLTVVNTTVSNNAAGAGGGICLDDSDIRLRNVTVTQNFANTWGGGTFQNDTQGGPGSTLSFGNTIIAGNDCIDFAGNRCSFYWPEIAFSPFAGHEVISEGGNLVGDSPGDSDPIHTNGIITYQPTDIRDTDPMLGPLQNNGGPIPTRALLPGSPAIDRGINALVSPLASVFDQRGTGFARFREGNNGGTATLDIGAFEFQNGTMSATISGRVLTPDGRGLRNATVSVTDSQGVRRIVTTSSFGFFTFDNVATGGTYVIGVSSRLYRFTSQTVQVDGNLTNIDFVGSE